MKKIALSILFLGFLSSVLANEILDVKITKIEKVNKEIDSLYQYDFNVDFLFDNMDCNTEMSFDYKKTYIYSNAFYCKTSDYSRLYQEFPTLNKKYEYIIIEKATGTKIIDLNSIEKFKLSIQKKLVQ